MVEIAHKYRVVQKRVEKARMASGQSRNHVVLIAVSKTKSADEIEALYELGHRDFGENYVQELLEKDKELKARGHHDIRWHFIGHLQRNKVKQLLPIVYAIHTVDSVALAREISKSAQKLGSKDPIPVFIEVNIDEESSKAGVRPSELKNVLSEMIQIPQLNIKGLMCIPRPGNSHQAFQALHELDEECKVEFSEFGGLLSMGMSDDFETAINDGATHVRVGSAIFGERLK